jgi:hypothetical protein
MVGVTVLAGALALSWASAALAHGDEDSATPTNPSVAVVEDMAAPGGTITVSGDGLGANGDSVAVTLHSPTFHADLGMAKLNGDSFDGLKFTLPNNVPVGIFSVVATNGPVTASAPIEVVAGTGNGMSGMGQ